MQHKGARTFFDNCIRLVAWSHHILYSLVGNIEAASHPLPKIFPSATNSASVVWDGMAGIRIRHLINDQVFLRLSNLVSL